MKTSIKGMLLVVMVLGFIQGLSMGEDGTKTDDSSQYTIAIIHTSISQILARNVVKEAYRKIGISVEFESVPPSRALELSNMGVVEGETARIEGLEKEYPNLVRVPFPVSYMTAAVFTKHIDRDIRSWKDLDGLKIGIIKGVLYSERGTRGMQTFYAKENTHLFKLLESGRIDVGIAVKEEGEYEAKTHFSNSNIHMIGQPVFSAPLYHYVHKKNTYLIPRLETVLKEMAEHGEQEKIWEQTRQSLGLP